MQSSLPWIESTRLSRNSKNKQIVPDTSLHEQDSNTLFILHGNEEDKEQFLTQESQKLIPDTRPTISQRQRKVQQNCDITTPPKHSRERPIKKIASSIDINISSRRNIQPFHSYLSR